MTKNVKLFSNIANLPVGSVGESIVVSPGLSQDNGLPVGRLLTLFPMRPQ